MPFTFSHPAVIIPFKKIFKNRLSVTGLAVGSMMPDIEYFVRMEGLSTYGHTWDGVLWFDMPIGVAVAFIFHNYIRNSFIDHLPLFLQSRLQPPRQLNWNQWIGTRWPVFILCLIAGSASHILWDGFTHETANLLRGLVDHYQDVNEGEDFLIYYLFFCVNSVAGIALLISYTRKLPVYKIGLKQEDKFPYWSFIVMIAIIVFVFRLIVSDDLSFLSTVDSAISALLIGMAATTIIKSFWRKGKLVRG